MAFDPRVLFEPERYRPTYASDEAELDAVRSRKKAISMFAWSRDDLKTRDFEWLTDQAFDRGLAVILDPDTDRDVRCFVLHHDQAWRVPALRAVWQTARAHGRWTDDAEAQMGLLLGYSDRERTRWLAEQRWRQPAWGCSTVYSLVASRVRTITVGMTLFQHAQGHVMKKRAARLAPDGLVIARLGIDPRLASKLLGKPRRGIASGQVSAAVAKAIDPAALEFLGPTGWR